MNRDQLFTKLQNASMVFNSLDRESIVRKVSLGSNSLQDYEKYIDEILNKFYQIRQYREFIGNIELNSVLDFYERFYAFISKVSKYTDSDYIVNRSKIVNDLYSFHAELRNIWSPIAAIVAYHNINFNLESSVDEAKKMLESEIEKTMLLQKSLEQLTEDYKERYSDINVNVELEKQVNVFEIQAKKNLNDANKWLYGIIGSSALLIITLISMYFDLNLSDSAEEYGKFKTHCLDCGNILWIEIAKHIFFKLLIISTNIYVLSFCVKNYNACMHNKTNNDHRHNSFRAALHFYNTTTSEKREEILIKVADAIFTYQKSGYFGKDSEPSNPSIIQSVLEKTTGSEKY